MVGAAPHRGRHVWETQRAAWLLGGSFRIETEDTSVIALGQDWKLRLTTKCHEGILGLHRNVLKIKL